MRKVMLLLIIFVSLTITGCMNKVEIPKEKKDILAEHISTLVLKYDKNYDQTLTDNESEEPGDSNADLMQEKKTDASDKVEETKPEQDTQSVNGLDVLDEQNISKEFNLNQVMNVKGLEIEFSKYGLYDSYPKKPKNTYNTLDARENRKLLIAEFKITNKTSKEKKIDLMSSQIDYTLEVNSIGSFKPIIALHPLLMNDLQYIDIKIKADSSQTGYLIFEVPKDIELNNTNITISNGKMAKKIGLV